MGEERKEKTIRGNSYECISPNNDFLKFKFDESTLCTWFQMTKIELRKEFHFFILQNKNDFLENVRSRVKNRLKMPF